MDLTDSAVMAPTIAFIASIVSTTHMVYLAGFKFMARVYWSVRGVYFGALVVAQALTS